MFDIQEISYIVTLASLRLNITFDYYKITYE